MRFTKFRTLSIWTLFLVLSSLALTVSGAGAAPSQQEAEPVALYFFWGDGCPVCADQKPFLEQLDARYPNLEVRSYEIYYDEENRELFLEMAAALGFEARAVPTTIVGEQVWIGYTEEYVAPEIEAAVAACSASGCPDAGAGLADASATPTPVPPTATPMPTVEICSTAIDDCAEEEGLPLPEDPSGNGSQAPPAAEAFITIPLLGRVDLGARSLWVSTALIGFVDGFNPCSIWVLSVLIALTLRTRSRKKILIIGLTFITITALVYVLFIAGLFTVLTFVSFMGWIQVAVSLLALFFALINIKDYLWYKEGLSFTIDDAKKPGLYQRMRRVLQAGDSLKALVVATMGLALGVSLVEFSCTAGFPVLWSNLVAAQNVTPLTFGLLLLLYMVIYQLDELAIFMVAVVTLRASKLEEKHGRILKLISGILMFALAAVMLIDPALMNDLSSALLIFAAAFGISMLVLVLHRKVLPRFGIYIGTELEAAGSK